MKNPYSAKNLEKIWVDAHKRNRGRDYWLYCLTRGSVFFFWLVADPILTWRRSRIGLRKAFLLGLPVVLVMLATIVGLYLCLLTDQHALASRYILGAQKAQLSENSETARNFYHKALTLNPHSRQGLLMEAARVAADLGFETERDALLLQLTDQTGYGPAHVFMARESINEQMPSKRKAARDHLKDALTVSPNLAEAHALLGKLYIQEGDESKAIPHFEAAAASLSDGALSLALLYSNKGHSEETIRWAKEAERISSARLLNAAPKSISQLHYGSGHAKALAISGNLKQAAAEIEKLYRDHSEQAVAPTLSAVYALNSRILMRSPKASDSTLSQALAQLSQAIRLAATERVTVTVLSAFVGLEESDWNIESQVLESLLAQGQSPWLLHWTLAVRRLSSGASSLDDDHHWKIALELEPESAVLLAYVVERSNRVGSLPREESLRLLSIAKAACPTETKRGKIDEIYAHFYTKEESWNEAINAYLAALTGGQERPDLHLALADLYEQIDDTAAAARHRQNASSLQPNESS